MLSSTLLGGKLIKHVLGPVVSSMAYISSMEAVALSFHSFLCLGNLTLFDFSGHCKKLTPEYAAAAAILAERDPPIYLAKVDATENNALSERFEVKGFPTLHWFV